MIQETLRTRLLEHADNITSPTGANASDLVRDLREAAKRLAKRLEPIAAASNDRPDPIDVTVVRWARENSITCSLGQLNALCDALRDPAPQEPQKERTMAEVAREYVDILREMGSPQKLIDIAEAEARKREVEEAKETGR